MLFSCIGQLTSLVGLPDLVNRNLCVITFYGRTGLTVFRNLSEVEPDADSQEWHTPPPCELKLDSVENCA